MKFDTDNFSQDVIDKSFTIPVVVDFWAEWCNPCKIIGPILENLANQNKGIWELVKLDTESNPQIAAKYNIRSIPSVKLFIDGEVKTEFSGAIPEPQIIQWLSDSIPSRYASELKGARQLLVENNPDKASDILNPILALEPENQEAMILLAWVYLVSDFENVDKIIEPIKLGSEYFDTAQAIKHLSELFKLLQNPHTLGDDSVRDSYLLAVSSAHAGNFEQSLEIFTGIVKINRKFDNDGARKACISIFQLLGNEDSLTRKYRPILSSVLY
ncbi:MAG: tetratricopeptide repeat protein [Chloroflexota bacterium]|nr:tetratricopeptide repeat protein [Chloroflexota bacterium]